MFYPRGEVVAAGAAGDAGTAYTLSTLSGCRLEDVGAATKGPLWYQLYLVGGHDVATAGLERARRPASRRSSSPSTRPSPDCASATSGTAPRSSSTRNPWTMLPYRAQFLARPRWLAGFLGDGGLMKFPNVVLPDGPMPYADVGAALEQSTVCWDDLAWIRDVWKGPIVIKGVHTGDDARRAVDEGADGVVVSNHGGRQLDGVYADPARAARGRRGGERPMRGAARRRHPPWQRHRQGALPGRAAVLIGRAYAYGLGAGGGPGSRAPSRFCAQT